jgi:hypothetical protein
MAENIRKFIQTLSQIPSWEEERENMLGAMNKVFAANGWDAEPDLFAMDLITELEQLPPTAFQQRFDTLVGALSDRYMLSEEQEQIMRRTIQRESQELFMKHSGRIMQYGLEAIQTRIAGEPFTPEQVARWVSLAEPVFMDARERVKVVSERFMEHLDPEQQGLLRRDLEADDRRATRMLEMAQGWKRGEWQASDWGLDEDPIQTGAGRAADAAAGQDAAAAGAADPRKSRPGVTRAEDAPQEPPATDTPSDTAAPSGGPPATPPAAAAVTDNDPWAQYVRDFTRRYSLNDTQQQRAWLIYKEVRQHRDQLLRRAAARGTANEPPPAGSTPAPPILDEKQQSAVDRLYEQLKRRLERLPTRAQRKAAAVAEPTRPAKPADRP